MKVYMFYMQFDNGLSPRLYAFTDSKKERDEFCLTRDMNLFHEKVVSMDKNKWCEMNSYFGYCKLYYHDCRTKDLDSYRLTTVRILMTSEETTNILLGPEEILPLRFKDIMIDTSIFTNEINESLFHLGYFYIYQWLYMNQYIYVPLSDKFAGINNEMTALRGDHFIYDEYKLFMRLYGRTMNTKFKI